MAHTLLTHFIGLFRDRLFVDWNNSVRLKHFRVKFIPLDTKDLRRIHEVRYANLGSRDISKELMYHHHEINQSEHSMLTNESAPVWVGL